MSNNKKVTRYRVDFCDEFDGTHFSRYYNTKEEATKECSEFNSQQMSSAHIVDLLEVEINDNIEKYIEKFKKDINKYIHIYDLPECRSKISKDAFNLCSNIYYTISSYNNEPDNESDNDLNNDDKNIVEPPKKKPRTK